MDIKEINQLLELRETNPSLKFEWIDPKFITGLNKSDVLLSRNEESGWTDDDDPSEKIFKYMNICYSDKAGCLNESDKSLTERYVEGMVYLIVEYNSSLATISVPEQDRVTFKDASKCLMFFRDVLLNKDLTESEIDWVQSYMCDFYQYDDLWDPPEGRFYKQFSKIENIMLDFLATRDLSISSLKEFGIPDEIKALVSETNLIQKSLLS